EGYGAITGDDLPGPGQFRLMTSRNRLVPGKSSSAGVTKSLKMTYRGLANSSLRQNGSSVCPVSHLAKSANRI
ncbi:MAG: hypothetical protein ACK56F_30330, partial [bacterium]